MTKPWLVSVLALRGQGRQSEVLLLRRQSSLVGAWCQIAGKIKTGETVWQAALRELHEETGLVPTSFYSADICEQFYESSRDQVVTAPVFVGFVDPDQPVVLNHEHSDFRWLSFKDARALVSFPGQRRVLKSVARGFVARSPNPHLLIEMPERKSDA